MAARAVAKKENPRWMFILHLAPFFLISLFYLYTTLSLEFFINRSIAEAYIKVVAPIELPSFLLYGIFSIREVNRLKEPNALELLQKRLLIYISLVFIVLIIFSFAIISLIELLFPGFVVNVRLVAYLILLAIPVMIIQHRFKVGSIKEEKPEPVKSEKRYDKSGLSEADLEAYKIKLNTYMERNKPYLNAELTLASLSEEIEIPRHHLTQLLNSVYDKTFYQFINERRIQEAINRIENNAMDGNFLQLANDVGFNSKSSFNNYFKKVTDKTPSQYKNELPGTSLNPT